jgi:hypothetical protein
MNNKWIIIRETVRSVLSGRLSKSDAQRQLEISRRTLNRLTRQELIEKLTVEVRGKVSKESTISLAGQPYRVPAGYIGARIWVKILGNRVYFEAMGRIFWKQRLKV